MKFLGINVTCTTATALQKISAPYFERHTVLVDQKPILLICQLSPKLFDKFSTIYIRIPDEFLVKN